MTYQYGRTSRQRMEGVHPILVERAERALSYGILDATILQFGGLRTLDDQKLMVARGASKTLNSLHRKQSTGYGHAIDIAPFPVDWDDLTRFNMWATLMFRAAMEDEYDVPLEWGGHWGWDYPHFQLPRGFKG
jgi:peptidoglycan LD-endopeptidase CwlK